MTTAAYDRRTLWITAALAWMLVPVALLTGAFVVTFLGGAIVVATLEVAIATGRGIRIPVILRASRSAWHYARFRHYAKRHRWRVAVVELMWAAFAAKTSVAILAIGTGLIYLGTTHSTTAAFFAAIALFTFLYLYTEFVRALWRAEGAERRGRQLASGHLGVISALMHTLDLRDRMTARHCAAVARYSREIARELGLPVDQQELVHTAGLLHDIGKFVFPDHILKADVALTERDWQIIKSHPYQGAKILSQVDGYGPISEIVLAHHERWDGGGYPRKLAGEDIPLLSRIISVVEAYDVMTARDTYRDPVSSMEAMRELQRVAGAQLDPQVVDAFIRLLASVPDTLASIAEEAEEFTVVELPEMLAAYAGRTASAGPQG